MPRIPAHPPNVVGEILQDLANELHAVEEVAHNVSMSAHNNACNPESHTSDLDEEMDASYDGDILSTLEKEVQQVCGKLACLIDGIGPVFPKSTEHAFQSYFMRLMEEIKTLRLMNKKNALQEKGFQKRIRLLQLEKNSVERAVTGAQKRLMAEEEENERAGELLRRVHEEFIPTRRDLALTGARDSEDSYEWTNISSHLASHVELLLRDLIIELNPANCNLARLTI